MTIIRQSLHGYNGRPTLDVIMSDGHMVTFAYDRRHRINATQGTANVPVPSGCATLEEAAERVAAQRSAC